MITSLKKRLLAYGHGRKRAIFLHTQKTAGSTLAALARARYGQDMISHGDYLERSDQEVQDISFISGHFGFGYAHKFMRNRYSFTFLRNPVDRIISFYYFCRNSNPSKYPIYDLSQKIGLESFLRAGIDDPLVRLYIWNQQTWQLAYGSANPENYSIHDFSEEVLLRQAIDNLAKFSKIAFTETFEQDLPIICSALSLPVPTERIVKNRTVRPSLEMLSTSEKKLAQDLTYLDDELYRTAWIQRHGKQQLPYN